MWRKLRISSKIIKICSFALVLFSFVSSGMAFAEKAPLPTCIKVPTTQWEQLKKTLTEQEVKLIALDEQLKMLKTPSNELVKQLTIAQSALNKSQTELTVAGDNLQNASNSIAELKTSLQTLKVQVDKERAIHRKQLTQNRLWAFIGGLIIGHLSN